MRANFELFLRSSEYRKICLRMIFDRLLSIILIPYFYVSAVIKTQKFKREHPSRWEQYLREKELEENSEKAKRLYQIAYNKIQFTGAITMMSLVMIQYIADYEMDDEGENRFRKPIEKLNKEFTSYKRQACRHMYKLQKLCGDFPLEVFAIVEYSSYDTYSDFESAKDFTDRVQSFVKDIEEEVA